jgi:hypothetical protein
MSVFDEAKRLRVRAAARDDGLTRFDLAAADGAPCLLAQTVVVRSYPTTAASYFGCQAQTILGAEVEGGGATITPDGGVFFALNLGSAIPPVGTTIVATFVGNRWAFRYDG